MGRAWQWPLVAAILVFSTAKYEVWYDRVWVMVDSSSKQSSLMNNSESVDDVVAELVMEWQTNHAYVAHC